MGLKPTYGVVSRYGLIAFASSLDQIGPLTRDVRDSALVLSGIAGHDKRDTTSIDREYGDFGRNIGKEVRGMRIALPKEFLGEGLQNEIREQVLRAAKTLEQLGAEVVEVGLSSLKMHYRLTMSFLLQRPLPTWRGLTALNMGIAQRISKG